MKRILISSVLIVSMVLPAISQEKEEKLRELEKLEQQTVATATPDTTSLAEPQAEVLPAESDEVSLVKIGELVTIEEMDDETVIRVGKKAVKVAEDGEETEIHFGEEGTSGYRGRHRTNFSGHLGGPEFGYNSYSTGKWLNNDTPLEGYLDLNTAKSTSFNFLFPAVNLGFTNHFGLVTAIGLNFNNYRFDGNNSIGVDEDGLVTPVYPWEPIIYEKSKLATVYGFIPVMLELQIPVSHGSNINLGAGVVGAVKLGSHTKVVYYDDGKQKDKNRNDFNLNVLRYGVTARAGYEMVQVYGTCYLSPMFEKGKGPELYPFEIGIALTFND